MGVRISPTVAPMSDVTQILSAIDQGDPSAAEQLLPLVYEELRKLAAQKMAQERPGQTLQATALVHEAYIRLVDVDRAQHWDSRGHFFAAAAEATRRVLVENARRKRSLPRGGKLRRQDLLDADPAINPPTDELLALDEALSKLADSRPLAAQLVELRLFTGLSMAEAGQVLGISDRTARRIWVIGRYKLLQQIGEGGFGVVFMAQQIEPVKRKVALKIIKPDMDTKEVIARFEAER